MINKDLDNKILILYILSKLPYVTDPESVYDIACQNDIGYFEFSECLEDLIENGNVVKDTEGVVLSEKGIKNAEAVSGELPYTVKKKTDKLMVPLIESLYRKSLIVAQYTQSDDGFNVKLSMGDGRGKLLDLDLFVADEKQALSITKKFKKSAEKIYKEIVGLLS